MSNLKVSDGCVWIASIDPGKCNFAFIIEEVDLESLRKIKNIPKVKRYITVGGGGKKGKKKGKHEDDEECSQEYSQILNKTYLSGKTILLENLNLTKGLDKAKYIDSKVFVNLTDELDRFLPYWDKCSYIVIEQQMSFGKRKNNTLCLKIAQHALSYFTFLYRDLKVLMEFPAYHKTKILGAPGKMDKPERKKWAIEKAQEIWIDRDDFETARKVSSSKKKDDMSDVLVMCMAFVYLKFIDKII